MGLLSGILSINQRNFDYVARYNRRKDFPLVDDKIICKSLLSEAGIPHPKTLFTLNSFVEIHSAVERFYRCPEFVIKPSRGRAGGGILLLKQSDEGDGFLTPGGSRFDEQALQKHLGDILFGVYSFGKMGDRVLVEEKIVQHRVLNNFFPRGIADIRVILFKNRPVMAMLRIPTDHSDGKANLHQGAIGLSVDLDTGITGSGVFRGRRIVKHPDTGVNMSGVEVPGWKQLIEYCIRASHQVPLQYLGVDVVLDDEKGPMVLELNARPGLQIQVINKKGLLERLHQIEVDDES